MENDFIERILKLWAVIESGLWKFAGFWCHPEFELCSSVNMSLS